MPRALGLGCMRLSTDAARDDDRSSTPASPADKGFALRAGLLFHDAAEGWPTPGDARRKLGA